MSIRELCTTWAESTFEELIDAIDEIDFELKQRTKAMLSRLDRLNSLVNGSACERLPKIEEQSFVLNKTFSQIFHEAFEKEHFSPASYIVGIVYEAIKNNLGESAIDGIAARGLRTFTSMIREPDFAEQLRQELIKTDAKTSTELNYKIDGADHTDVLLTHKSEQYRIWLYQFSSRGLPHDIERMSGKRGELPPGTHIICPLHTEFGIRILETKTKISKAKDKRKLLKDKIESCSPKQIRTKEKLQSRIQSLDDDLVFLNQQLSDSRIEAKKELDEVDGWFFYSNDYIKRVASLIDNIENRQKDYSEVLSILTGPEKYIGEINSFRKEY